MQSEEQQKMLREEQEKIQRKMIDLGITQGYAVDLDDTCFDTTRAYYEGLSARFPAPADVAIDTVRKTYSLDGRLVYWNDIPDALAYAHELMDDPHFNRHIHPFAEAAPAVRRLHERRIITCYKTARKERMRTVTREALAEHSFPDLPIIMLEDDTSRHHIDAKALSLHASYPHLRGIIDDSVRLARTVEESGYPGEFFLFGIGAEHYQPQNGRVLLARTWSNTEALLLERYGQ